MGRYYGNTHDYDLADNYLQEAYLSLQDETDRYYEYQIYRSIISHYGTIGDYDKAFSYAERFISKYQGKNNDFYLAEVYLDRINVYVNQAKLDIALDEIEKVIEINNHIESPELSWHTINYKGIIYQYKGSLPEAKTMHMQNQQIAESLRSEIKISGVYNNLGNVLNLMGEIDKAIDYNFKSLAIVEKIGHKINISMAYNNIATNYMLKGDLDRAEEYLNTSKVILEELRMEDSPDMATAYLNLGQVFHMQGKYELAKEYYQQCLEIDKNFGNHINIGEDYYNLLTLAIEMGDTEKAEAELINLQESNAKVDNKVLKLRTELGQMLILKTSKRAINLAKAQEILLKVVEEDPVVFELYTFALLNLCELLLIELNQTGEEEVLEEIREQVTKLHNYASSQQSYIFLAETNLLKSKLALLDLDFQTAKSYIEAAEFIASDRGLSKINQKISLYYDEFLDQMKALERFAKDDTSIKEKLSAIKLDDFIATMIRTRSEEVEISPEEPSLFLILEKGGTTLYKKNFSDTATINNELIAGLISALYTLSGEVFDTSGATQRIKHEDYTVITQPVSGDHSFLFCYVFKGNSFNALKKLERVTRSIVDSTTIWKALNREVANLTDSEQRGMDLILDQLLIKY
ncbi:MAG: tetratricopeptide repeat protein [Candidatus Kariarchaeaceae archaeon]